jgi:hypothetical protein
VHVQTPCFNLNRATQAFAPANSGNCKGGANARWGVLNPSIERFPRPPTVLPNADNPLISLDSTHDALLGAARDSRNIANRSEEKCAPERTKFAGQIVPK